MHGDPGNRSFLSDDKVDELLEAGRREADEEARLEIYSELQNHLVDVAPMAYIHHQNYLTGMELKRSKLLGRCSRYLSS